jgi:alkylhydroperoxidase/carboxymuconolactone decarboxylase family protein YurZ
MSSQIVDKIEDGYVDMIGTVPPKVHKRIRFSAGVDMDSLIQLESLRADFLDSKHLDAKQVQLMAFAILLTQTSAAAEHHARAAIRAGATKAELFDAAKVAFLFRGLAAMNHAGEVLSAVYFDPAAESPGPVHCQAE